jgi:predicted aldo/keto reductase-like oxidoreductase
MGLSGIERMKVLERKQKKEEIMHMGFVVIHGVTYPVINTLRNNTCWQFVHVGNTVHNWRHGVIVGLSALYV